MNNDKYESFTIGDFLDSIMNTKDDLDFNNTAIKGEYNSFMIDKFISSVDIFLDVANAMNINYSVPKAMHYEFYKSVLPKRKMFFPYISKSKVKALHKKEDIECIKKYYEISAREAEMYADLLNEQQIKMIVDKYDFGKTK